MEQWIGSRRREPLDRTLIWNLRHLMMVRREHEDISRRLDVAAEFGAQVLRWFP